MYCIIRFSSAGVSDNVPVEGPCTMPACMLHAFHRLAVMRWEADAPVCTGSGSACGSGSPL